MEPEVELEIELGKYFKLVSDGEQRLDISRRVLCEGINFDPELCFGLINVENKSYIGGLDLYNFLTL